MILTLLLSLMTMAGLFLMLWSGVAFIQDKRFFSSAHPDMLAIITPKNERFFGQHILGYILSFRCRINLIHLHKILNIN